MFSKVDIGGGLSDFWDYIREPRPHRWTAWGVAIVLPLVVFYGFSEHLIPYDPPKRQIIYFENWTADRSAAEVRADWVDRAKETTRRNAKKRAEYQRFADSLGIEYDSAEADRITRETIGAAAAEAAKQRSELPTRSTLAERAARGAAPSPDR